MHLPAMAPCLCDAEPDDTDGGVAHLLDEAAAALLLPLPLPNLGDGLRQISSHE
jgi:hypothetical protein